MAFHGAMTAAQRSPESLDRVGRVLAAGAERLIRESAEVIRRTRQLVQESERLIERAHSLEEELQRRQNGKRGN
jgi:hypothetical protein